MSEKLNPNRVEETTKYCLFKDGESTDDAVLVEGIVSKYGFHPGRLAESKAAIVEMLLELPDTFMIDGGKGMSFLNACDDRHGEQWTGEHRTMEQLFALGMAVNRVKCALPRDMWSVLPGSVPYYTIYKEDID